MVHRLARQLTASPRDRFPAALAMLLLGAGVLQAQRPEAIVHFPLQLADVSLAASTVSGLVIILQPAVNTKEGKFPENLICLRFHPDSALEWINSAAFALEAPVPPGAPDGVQWSRPLNALNARGAVTIGRERKKGTLQKARWLAVADSATGWRLEMTGKQADSLLQLVLHMGGLSRIDTTTALALEADRVDTPVRALQQPRPETRGDFGRVLVQFVVDTNGRADPGSLVAYLPTDSTLVEGAFRIVRASLFEPARRAGKPVRQLVWRVIAWDAKRR